MELEIDPSGIAITDTNTNTNTVAIDSSNIDISGTHKITLNDTNGISINNLTLQPTNTLGSATNITINELAHLSGVSSNIQTQFNLLKGDAPAALDTIAELADAIGDNANFVTDINTNIAAKVGKTGDETINGIKTIQGTLNFDTNGTISGDVIPVNNNLTNIGSASKQINAIHANDVNVSGDIHMNGNIDICGGNFTITNEELSKLDGVNDNIQTQINTAIAGNVWDVSGVKIHYNSGNVGIGTNDPTGKLEVHDGPIIVKPGTNATNALQFHSGSGNANYTNDIAWYDSGPTKKVMIGSSSNNTTGHFRFWENGSQDFTFINDSTNTKVGINRVDPQYNLDVTGDINLTGTLYQNGSEFNPSLWSESTGNVYRSSGNVGIGLSTPEKELHIYTTNQDNGATILLQSDGGNGGIPESSIHFKTSAAAVDSTASTWDSGRIYSSWHSASEDWNNSYIALQTHGTNTASFTNDLVVKGGYVGIGTSVPLSLFHTKGNGRFDGQLKLACTTSLNHQLNIEMKNTSYAEIQTIQQNVGYNQNLCLQPVAGNVGIGTTAPESMLQLGSLAQNSERSSPYDVQYKKLGLTSPYHNSGFYFATRDPNYNDGFLDIGFNHNGNNSYDKPNIMSINLNGNVGIGTSNPNDALTVQDDNSARVAMFKRPSATNSTYFGWENSNSLAYMGIDGTGLCNFESGALLMGVWRDKPIIFTTGQSNTEKMRIASNGNVGIGTTNPLVPLHINTTQSYTFPGDYPGSTSHSVNSALVPQGGNPYAYWNNALNYLNGAFTGNSQNYNRNDISIRAKGSIWTEATLIFNSDERIKTDISSVDDTKALDIVNNLDTKEYNYIDPIKKKQMKTIGFIAQDVNDVLPNAVSKVLNIIPDEMRIITEPIWIDCSYSTIRYESKTTYTETVRYEEGPILDESGNPVLDESGNQIIDPSAVQVVDPSGAEHVDPSGIVIEEWHPKWKLQIPNLDMSSNNTGRCRFYFSNDLSGNDETMKELTLDPSNNNTFEAIDERYNNVFFYGKEVDDFHTLDKAQIFALHHSAIQELSRKNDSLQTEKETMQTQITTLLEENNSMKSRLEALEAAIINLQNN